MALADENKNGQITWKEFIPVGIDAIKSFLARNKALEKQVALHSELSKTTFKFVYEGEIAKIEKVLQRRFEFYDTDEDTDEHSGMINFTQMKEILHGTSHLATKEINLLLRDYVMKYGYDSIKYVSFADDLYDVRFELAKSRLMDINIKKLPNDYFLKSGYPVDEEGKMQMNDIKKVLMDSKELILTPGQIFILLGNANVYHDGTIDAMQFGKQLKPLVERMFSTEAIRRKSQLVQLGVFKNENVNMPDLESLTLFKVFRDFDENDKGFLEPLEFKHCLE